MTSHYLNQCWPDSLMHRPICGTKGKLVLKGPRNPRWHVVRQPIIGTCLFVSLLSHFWLIHFFHLYLLYQPYLGLCQAQCVQSHQRQPMSAVELLPHARSGYPGIDCWFSDRSNCSNWRLTLTLTLTSENLSLYTTLLLVLVLIQVCSPRCWHLDSN